MKRRRMNELKNLKVDAAVHQLLKVAAAEDGLQIQHYAEACIVLALEHRAKLRRLAEERTRTAPKQEKP